MKKDYVRVLGYYFIVIMTILLYCRHIILLCRSRAHLVEKVIMNVVYCYVGLSSVQWPTVSAGKHTIIYLYTGRFLVFSIQTSIMIWRFTSKALTITILHFNFITKYCDIINTPREWASSKTLFWMASWFIRRHA